jgi:hypothetical protein
LPAFNLDKFIKLMMMTTSDHEQEALTALRMANAMLAAENKNWEELLKDNISMWKARREAPGGGYTRHVDPVEIEGMFEYLFRTVAVDSSFRIFVEDVYTWWQRRGFLTAAQFAALKRAIERSRA